MVYILIPRDIQRRSKALDSATIFQHYVELLTKLRSTSQDAKKLSAQARTEQRKRNELQGERFSLLTHSMLEINSRLSATYKRIVPEGDCYLNYASNPISLFEEGATLFAQHGQGSWQEVLMLHYHVSIHDRRGISN